MHPSSRDLLGLVLGTLDDRIANAVVSHLAVCAECEDKINHLEIESDELLKDLRQFEPHDSLEAEPQCRQLVDVVKCYGGDASLGATRMPLMAAMDLPDATELGQYQLMGKLGQGGMGAVFKALHMRLQKFVALKILPVERMRNTDALARFEREMQAVGQLNHPNIVAALDAGEAEGTHYLVMELVEGMDLSKLSRRLGPLDVSDACELVRQAALGLEYAHQRGMVHRDIKPSNLMLAAAEDGGASVKVLDLGLALWIDSQNPGLADLTDTGQTMGTYTYMAPEQGLDSHVVDARADLYALGATLYKLLTGEGPFSDEKFNSPLRLMMAKTTQPALSVAEKRSVPEVLAALVDRLLAVKPEDRPASAAAVAEALAPFAAGADLKALLDSVGFDSEPVPRDQSDIGTDKHFSRGSQDTPLTHQPSPPSEVRPAGAPRRRLAAYAAGIGIVVAAIGLTALFLSEPDTPARNAALPNGTSVVSPDPKSSAAHQAAMAVLQAGGRVEVKTEDSDPRWIEVPENLPAGPFSIEWIEVHRDRAQPITVNWLRDVLAGSPDLDGIALHEQSLGDEAMRLLAQPGSLSHAMLSDVGMTDAGLASLGSLPLVQLNVGKNEIGDSGIRALGTAPDLKLIVLTETKITDEALRQMAAWPRLQSLSLASTAITDRGLAHLEKRASLREIDLDGTQVTREGVDRLRRALPNCRVVSEFDP